MEDSVQVAVGDEFELGDYAVLVAEVHDSLGVGHPTYHGATDIDAFHDQMDLTDGVRLQSQSQLYTDSLGSLLRTGFYTVP